MLNILIVYYATHYPIRATIWDHLYSFQRHSGQRCFYWNLAFGKVPRFVKTIPFDLVIFDTIFLWYRADFERILPNAAPIKQLQAVKVALPQDEFFQTDTLCRFINEFGIDAVFSVMPPETWPSIYPTVDHQKVRFYTALTGYLEGETLARINRLASENIPRTIDIGYRAVHSPYFLGRHGRLKVKVAEAFQEHTPPGLVTDISTDEKDTFLGDDWYRFLLRCKYTIGVEGGASVLDHDGSIRQKVQAYLAQHPQASFEEVEAACFPGADGAPKSAASKAAVMSAISPRQLEACATRTCQILVEGEYNGILQAGKHYIALKGDFGNIEDVWAALQDDQARMAMVEQAYQDIVASGQYTYRSFVRSVIEQALGDRPGTSAGLWTHLLYHRLRVTDGLNWRLLALYTSVLRPLLAPEMRQRIRRFFGL